ncbi:MAG: ABC transporter ATP-binding protein [Phycisphaerae bacterium]|nr:ABC transporter ATP-binding protein [Phycisphaerae bacterium]
MTENAVQIDNLVKYFDGRCVLDGIDLQIPPGCIYGLLGRNGSGKTTIIRILLGLDSPTRGQTLLFDRNSLQLSAHDRSRIGYVAEGHHLIQHYPVAKLIKLARGLAPHWDAELFDHLINTFRLPLDRKVKKLSTGMRAQLNLALALAANPELLILDDPTLGLDTIVRRQFLELAIDLIQKQGRTILFSSHILSDVERIADRIGILLAGKLVVDCPLDQLKNRVKKIRLIFPQSAPTDLHLTDIVSQQYDNHELILTVANWNQQKQNYLQTYNPTSITEIPLSLEDIFIECTNPNPATLTIEPQGDQPC